MAIPVAEEDQSQKRTVREAPPYSKQAPQPSGGRMPALDGLRAVSIALVLLGHMSGTRGFLTIGLEKFVGDYANLGVTVFFVISGFLITTLLKKEEQKSGRISLRLFYARRILRLFPAFFLYLVFLIGMRSWGVIHLAGSDLLAAFTYTVNFRTANNWYIGHLWSLSVEEQFYLLWPAVLVIAGLRRSVWVTAAVILVSPLSRVIAVLLHLPGSIFPCVADSLAIGCLLAITGDRLLSRDWYLNLIRSPLLVPIAVLLMLVCNYSRIYLVGIAFGITGINVLICLLVHHCLHVNSVTSRFLSTGPLVAIGILSYSLYLWQQFFLDRHSDWAVCSFPVNTALAFAAATASYLVVERPLNELRRKLRPA
jgi:peptidoglycan/LPS O-acetylase OafA/YrhL